MDDIITKYEWLAELDRLSGAQKKLTDEQMAYVKYAREKVPPVSWENIESWLYKKFALKISDSTLRRYYKKTQGEK